MVRMEKSMDELKKQRSFWKSLKKKDIITAIIITVLVILIPVMYFYPLLLGILLISGFAIVSVIAVSLIIYGLIYFVIYKPIKSAKIIQKLPLSEEELKANHIETATQYLQSLYDAMKCFSVFYWHDRLEECIGNSDKSILDNIAFVYNSFEIKEEKEEARKSFLNELQYEPDEEEKVLSFIEMIQDVNVEDDNN